MELSIETVTNCHIHFRNCSMLACDRA